MRGPCGLTLLASSKVCETAHGFGVVIEVEEDEIPDLVEWCDENIRSHSWKLEAIGEAPYSLAKFWFNADEAVLVRLRWPGCSIQEYDRDGCPII